MSGPARAARFDPREPPAGIHHGTDPFLHGEACAAWSTASIGRRPFPRPTSTSGARPQITRPAGGAALPFRLAGSPPLSARRAGRRAVARHREVPAGIDESTSPTSRRRIAPTWALAAVALHPAAPISSYSGRATVTRRPAEGPFPSIRSSQRRRLDAAPTPCGCSARPLRRRVVGVAGLGPPVCSPPGCRVDVRPARTATELEVRRPSCATRRPVGAWLGPDRGIRDCRSTPAVPATANLSPGGAAPAHTRPQSLAETNRLLDELDPDLRLPTDAPRPPRPLPLPPRRGVTVPSGWLRRPGQDVRSAPDAEAFTSGADHRALSNRSEHFAVVRDTATRCNEFRGGLVLCVRLAPAERPAGGLGFGSRCGRPTFRRSRPSMYRRSSSSSGWRRQCRGGGRARCELGDRGRPRGGVDWRRARAILSTATNRPHAPSPRRTDPPGASPLRPPAGRVPRDDGRLHRRPSCPHRADSVLVLGERGAARPGRRLRHPGSGRAFVERIDGSYHNVVGLPLAQLESMCARMDIDLRSFAR